MTKYLSYILVHKLNTDIADHIFSILQNNTKICKTCHKTIKWSDNLIYSNYNKWTYCSQQCFDFI